MAVILVIEDCLPFHSFTRRALEAGGHCVVEAGDGAKDLAVYLTGGVDLVVCDVFLPGRDGLEILRGIRRHQPAAKVIMMSGGSFQGRLDMLPIAALLGACAVLRKPFSAEALLGAVEHALGRSQESGQLRRLGEGSKGMCGPAGLERQGGDP